jgi:hypothetical protein
MIKLARESIVLVLLGRRRPDSSPGICRFHSDGGAQFSINGQRDVCCQIGGRKK